MLFNTWRLGLLYGKLFSYENSGEILRIFNYCIVNHPPLHSVSPLSVMLLINYMFIQKPEQTRIQIRLDHRSLTGNRTKIKKISPQGWVINATDVVSAHVVHIQKKIQIELI